MTLIRPALLGLAAASILALAAPAAIAQQSPPLHLTTKAIPGAQDSSKGIELQLRNASAKPIAAYVVRFDHFDINRKLISRQTSSSITRGLGVGRGRPSYAPGESWQERPQVADPQETEIAVDLVLFEDGTHWGPDLSSSRPRLKGMKEGAQMERLRQNSR